MTIFKNKKFTSHSGKSLQWKIECDNLSNEDLDTLVYLIIKKYKFFDLYGVPKGGIPLATKLQSYINLNADTFLIVDDVYTTGTSMWDSYDKYKHKYKYIQGIVIFSRTIIIPKWIDPIFTTDFLHD